MHTTQPKPIFVTEAYLLFEAPFQTSVNKSLGMMAQSHFKQYTLCIATIYPSYKRVKFTERKKSKELTLV